jgi:hypothetical protein
VLDVRVLGASGKTPLPKLEPLTKPQSLLIIRFFVEADCYNVREEVADGLEAIERAKPFSRI